MDFTLDARSEDFPQRIRAFFERGLFPREPDPDTYDHHEIIRLDLHDQVRGKARAEGLWHLQVPQDLGGLRPWLRQSPTRTNNKPTSGRT